MQWAKKHIHQDTPGGFSIHLCYLLQANAVEPFFSGLASFFSFGGRVWFLFLTCIACTLSINQARRRAKKYLRRARNNTPMCPSLSIVSLSQGSLTHLLLLRAARKTEKGRSLFERLSLSQSISTATVISSLPTPTLRYIFKWDAQQQPFLLHTRYST